MSASISIILEPAAWITCHDYGTERPPILAAYGTGENLTVFTAGHLSAQERIEVSRRFADAATQLLALTEAWASANTISLIKAG